MKTKKSVTFVLGFVLAVAIVIGVIYARQRLFTQAEPIVLEP